MGYSASVTTLRRATRWAWPHGQRPAGLALWTRFWLHLGLYGSLGLAAWGHWWNAVRPWGDDHAPAQPLQRQTTPLAARPLHWTRLARLGPQARPHSPLVGHPLPEV